jgi:hypothetical protein
MNYVTNTTGFIESGSQKFPEYDNFLEYSVV